MEKLKFILFSIVTLSLLGIVGYWSIATIQSGSEHKNNQKIKQLQKENEDLRQEVEKQKSELNILQAKLQISTPIVEKEPEVPEKVVNKHQSLIDELQKLADANVLLKDKAQGPRVGTVQKFLNIYNNTSIKVDNDYGPGTVSRVSVFQKESGLSADGEAGKTTFSKMIEWLKTQG